MSEEYRQFDAAEYVKTETDARELLEAAADEDLGDGAVIRAALRYLARTQTTLGTHQRFDASVRGAESREAELRAGPGQTCH